MSGQVTLVVCDHSCRQGAPVDYDRLSSDLLASECVTDVVVAPRACRNGLPDLKLEAGTSLIFAGCDAINQAEGFAALGGTDREEHRETVIADTRAEVFDLYREPGAIQDNLRRKLLSLSLVMASADAESESRAVPDAPVLVAGDGISGVLTALHLRSLGFTVELARSHGYFYSPGSYHLSLSTPALERELTQKLQDPPAWSIPDKVRALVSDDGLVVVSGPERGRRYSSLVLVPEMTESGSYESGAIPLSECYARIKAGDDLRGETCFLLDQHHPTDPATFADVLRAALHIVANYRGEVSVLMRDARISGADGQHLYDACREAGVVFIKYGDDLNVRSEYGDFVITGTDAQSAAEFTLHEPQTVVVPGEPALPPWADSLMESLALRDADGEFTQDESLWLLPNATNRAAVFTAGSGRRRMDADEIVRDAVGAALSTAGLLTATDANRHTAVVTERACARCLTCVRSCPYGAMRKEPGHKAAMAHPAECHGCGICAAVCPARAIELQDRGTGKLVDSMGVFKGLLVLHCAEGGRKAVRRMIDSGKSLPPDVGLYELPCSGRVEESVLLDVLGTDVRGVLVVGCRKDNCKFLDGNKRALNRVRRVERLMQDAGISGSHVEMFFAAPDEGRRVHDAIMTAYGKLNESDKGEVGSGTDSAGNV